MLFDSLSHGASADVSFETIQTYLSLYFLDAEKKTEKNRICVPNSVVPYVFPNMPDS